jgi:hypothetical protein
VAGAAGLGGFFDVFLGDEKKARMPLLDAGAAGRGGGAGVGTMVLNMAMMWGSRRIFRVSVNSNLLCSILRWCNAELE